MVVLPSSLDEEEGSGWGPGPSPFSSYSGASAEGREARLALLTKAVRFYNSQLRSQRCYFGWRWGVGGWSRGGEKCGSLRQRKMALFAALMRAQYGPRLVAWPGFRPPAYFAPSL